VEVYDLCWLRNAAAAAAAAVVVVVVVVAKLANLLNVVDIGKSDLLRCEV